MAGSVNKAILLGNLGQDPDVKYTQDGRKIVNLSIATSESWKDKQTGERREKVEWHRVAVFGPLADIADKYLRKGSKVMVEGSLHTRKWQAQDGSDRYSTEVHVQGYGANLVLLDGKAPESSKPAERNGYADATGQDAKRDYQRSLDDEMPF